MAKATTIGKSLQIFCRMPGLGNGLTITGIDNKSNLVAHSSISNYSVTSVINTENDGISLSSLGFQFTSPGIIILLLLVLLAYIKAKKS